MELNREQIIKALECCLVESNCTDCPLHHQYEIDCLKYAGVKALSLIKELTEENEVTLRQYTEYQEAATQRMRELTEENERLTTNLVEQSAENVMLIGENKRLELQIEVKERILDSYMLQYGTVADKEVWLKKERADTVRKLADLIWEGELESLNICFSRAFFASFNVGYILIPSTL